MFTSNVNILNFAGKYGGIVFSKMAQALSLAYNFVSVGALVFDSGPTADQMQPCGALYVYICD